MNWRGSRIPQPDRGTAQPIELHLALLLAARQRKQASWRWLNEKLRVALRNGLANATALGETPETPPGEPRDYAMRMLEALDKAGMVEITRTGRQIVAVKLRRRAAGAWLWSKVGPNMLRRMRPTVAVEEMAREAGVMPRTAWRWLAGQTVPSPENVGAVFHLLSRQVSPAEVRELRAKYGPHEPVAWASVHSLFQVFADHTFFMQNAELTDPEVERATAWLMGEYRPYMEAIDALGQRETKAEKDK